MSLVYSNVVGLEQTIDPQTYRAIQEFFDLFEANGGDLATARLLKLTTECLGVPYYKRPGQASHAEQDADCALSHLMQMCLRSRQLEDFMWHVNRCWYGVTFDHYYQWVGRKMIGHRTSDDIKAMIKSFAKLAKLKASKLRDRRHELIVNFADAPIQPLRHLFSFFFLSLFLTGHGPQLNHSYGCTYVVGLDLRVATYSATRNLHNNKHRLEGYELHPFGVALGAAYLTGAEVVSMFPPDPTFPQDQTMVLHTKEIQAVMDENNRGLKLTHRGHQQLLRFQRGKLALHRRNRRRAIARGGGRERKRESKEEEGDSDDSSGSIAALDSARSEFMQLNQDNPNLVISGREEQGEGGGSSARAHPRNHGLQAAPTSISSSHHGRGGAGSRATSTSIGREGGGSSRAVHRENDGGSSRGGNQENHGFATRNPSSSRRMEVGGGSRRAPNRQMHGAPSRSFGGGYRQRQREERQREERDEQQREFRRELQREQIRANRPTTPVHEGGTFLWASNIEKEPTNLSQTENPTSTEEPTNTTYDE